MIIPNTWLLNLKCSRIRRHIFDSVSIEQIVHYQYPVFPHATVDTQSTILRKTRPTRAHKLGITIVARDGTRESYKVPQQRWRDGDGKPVNIMERPEMLALSDRLQSFPTFGDLCRITQGCKPFQVGKGKPRQTRRVVDEKPFVSTKARDGTFRPLLRGSLIGRYRTTWKHNYFISFGDWLAEPRHSANHDAPAKLVIRQTGDSLVATLDDRRFVVRDNLYTLLGLRPDLDLRFVLGVLNSSILNWFYQCVLNPERGEALAQVKRGHLARLPLPVDRDLPDAAAEQCSRVSDAVDRMLDLNNRLLCDQSAEERSALGGQIKTLETHIDDLVGRLFGLNESEMATVRRHQGQAP